MDKFVSEVFYYVIKVSNKKRCFYKIGEGSQKRPQQLVNKYNKRSSGDVDAELLLCESMPRNQYKRLTDKSIRETLLKNYTSKVVSADEYAVKGVLNGEDDGCTEFVQTTLLEKPFLQVIKDTVNVLGQNKKNFTTKVKYVNNIRLTGKDSQKHQVPAKLIEKIEEKLKRPLGRTKNKNILLIGQFLPEWVSTFAMHNKLYIWHDDTDQQYEYKYAPLNECINYINDLRKLLSMKINFDYIIANPPYELGNEITNAIIENADFRTYVNLMPASVYRKNELYKNVLDIETVEDAFEDAIVGESLTLARLGKTKTRFADYEDFSNQFRDSEFKDFYILNSKVRDGIFSEVRYSLPGEKTQEALNVTLSTLTPEYDFCMTLRTCVDGVHELNGPGAFDIKWNINKNVSSKDIHTVFDKSKKLYMVSTLYIKMPSEHAKDNFCKFWYTGKNGLMSALIKGLNKSSDSCIPAIPRINYEVDRDYANLTLEDIIRIIKEENPELR